MAEPGRRPDEDVAEELLEVLRADDAPMPEDLPVKTIRRVQALLSARDIIDLATVVFLLEFCAPLLDLVAAMLGHDPRDALRARPPDDPPSAGATGDAPGEDERSDG